MDSNVEPIIPEITPLQVKTIKTLQRKVGLGDADYRRLLRRSYGKNTCKALTSDEAHDLIVSLRVVAMQLERSGHPDRLTQSQQSVIRKLWREVSYLPPDEQDAGLRAFLKRQCGVEILSWVPRSSAPSIICALKSMKNDKGEKP